MSYDGYTLQTPLAQVGIHVDGGYVTSWRVRNPHINEFVDILYSGSVLKRSGIPILFPHFGKSNTMRFHGFGRSSRWRVLHQQIDSLEMYIDHESIDEEGKKEYPFQFYASITVSIGKDSELLYALTVENRDSKPLPISPGLHPYWTIPHELKEHILIDGISGFDAQTIDWTEAPPDTRFDFNGPVTVHLPDKQISIEDVSPSGPVIKDIVVWSQTPSKDPDFNFVCIEPLCGYNFDIENNPIMVAPGQKWTMSLRFSVRW